MLCAVTPTSSGTCSRTSMPAPVSADLVGAVGQQPHGAHTEVDEDRRTGAEVTSVGRQTETEVGLDRVGAEVLQGVGAQLVQQTDAAPLVAAEVDHHSDPGIGDPLQRGTQLRSAVAACRPERIAREAFGVHPHEDVGATGDVAAHECEVLLTGRPVAVAERAEVARIGGEHRLGDSPDRHQPITVAGARGTTSP